VWDAESGKELLTLRGHSSARSKLALAEHPKEADPFIPQHLTCCSPCFNRYMEILAELKHQKKRDSFSLAQGATDCL
jgi:hypothetical protein